MGRMGFKDALEDLVYGNSYSINSRNHSYYINSRNHSYHINSSNHSYSITVSVHDFKWQKNKLSVSNPESKDIAYLSVLSQISNCLGRSRKNKHTILKTDRSGL